MNVPIGKRNLSPTPRSVKVSVSLNVAHANLLYRCMRQRGLSLTGILRQVIDEARIAGVAALQEVKS